MAPTKYYQSLPKSLRRAVLRQTETTSPMATFISTKYCYWYTFPLIQICIWIVSHEAE